MTKNDAPAEDTSENETLEKVQPSSVASIRAADQPTMAETKKTPFIKLHDYVTDVPLKVRLPIYIKIERAVKHGEVFGIVHPTDLVDVLVLDAKSAEVTRSFRQVLVSNSAAMLAKLEQLSTAAVVAEVIRTGARNFSVEELQDMGDALDFDAMAAAARKREAARTRAKAVKNRNRLKNNSRLGTDHKYGRRARHSAPSVLV